MQDSPPNNPVVLLLKSQRHVPEASREVTSQSGNLSFDLYYTEASKYGLDIEYLPILNISSINQNELSRVLLNKDFCNIYSGIVLTSKNAAIALVNCMENSGRQQLQEHLQILLSQTPFYCIGKSCGEVLNGYTGLTKKYNYTYSRNAKELAWAIASVFGSNYNSGSNNKSGPNDKSTDFHKTKISKNSPKRLLYLCCGKRRTELRFHLERVKPALLLEELVVYKSTICENNIQVPKYIQPPDYVVFFSPFGVKSFIERNHETLNRWTSQTADPLTLVAIGRTTGCAIKKYICILKDLRNQKWKTDEEDKLVNIIGVGKKLRLLTLSKPTPQCLFKEIHACQTMYRPRINS